MTLVPKVPLTQLHSKCHLQGLCGWCNVLLFVFGLVIAIFTIRQIANSPFTDLNKHQYRQILQAQNGALVNQHSRALILAWIVLGFSIILFYVTLRSFQSFHRTWKVLYAIGVITLISLNAASVYKIFFAQSAVQEVAERINTSLSIAGTALDPHGKVFDFDIISKNFLGTDAEESAESLRRKYNSLNVIFEHFHCAYNAPSFCTRSINEVKCRSDVTTTSVGGIEGKVSGTDIAFAFSFMCGFYADDILKIKDRSTDSKSCEICMLNMPANIERQAAGLICECLEGARAFWTDVFSSDNYEMILWGNLIKLGLYLLIGIFTIWLFLYMRRFGGWHWHCYCGPPLSMGSRMSCHCLPPERAVTGIPGVTLESEETDDEGADDTDYEENENEIEQKKELLPGNEQRAEPTNKMLVINK